jgi:hypothetical protein
MSYLFIKRHEPTQFPLLRPIHTCTYLLIRITDDSHSNCYRKSPTSVDTAFEEIYLQPLNEKSREDNEANTCVCFNLHCR